jgi:hypothetical protein
VRYGYQFHVAVGLRRNRPKRGVAGTLQPEMTSLQCWDRARRQIERSKSKDAPKLTKEGERVRLTTCNDTLHDEQEGRVYIHCTY